MDVALDRSADRCRAESSTHRAWREHSSRRPKSRSGHSTHPHRNSAAQRYRSLPKTVHSIHLRCSRTQGNRSGRRSPSTISQNTPKEMKTRKLLAFLFFFLLSSTCIALLIVSLFSSKEKSPDRYSRSMFVHCVKRVLSLMYRTELVRLSYLHVDLVCSLKKKKKI
jgi:hypothetical protein